MSLYMFYLGIRLIETEHEHFYLAATSRAHPRHVDGGGWRHCVGRLHDGPAGALAHLQPAAADQSGMASAAQPLTPAERERYDAIDQQVMAEQNQAIAAENAAQAWSRYYSPPVPVSVYGSYYGGGWGHGWGTGVGIGYGPWGW